MNLMIGDWVFYEGKPLKVKNTHKNCINFEPDIYSRNNKEERV